MRDRDDFLLFQIMSEEDKGAGRGGGSGCFPWLLALMAIIWLIGKLG